MSSHFTKFLDWIGRFQVIQSVVQSEFIGTLLAPVVMSVMAAYAGLVGDVQLMWIIMATALTFMATVQGLLRLSEYMERKSPLNKLVYLRVSVDRGLVVPPPPSGQQTGQASIPARQLDWIQLGCDIRNVAPFPISVILVSAESEVEGMTPPRAKYPKPAITIRPGLNLTVCDERIAMKGLACGQWLTGKIDLRLKYGRPGKERFALNTKCDVQAVFRSDGMATKFNAVPAD